MGWSESATIEKSAIMAGGGGFDDTVDAVGSVHALDRTVGGPGNLLRTHCLGVSNKRTMMCTSDTKVQADACAM